MSTALTMGTPVRRALSDLDYYPGNARQGDVPAIKASLEKFGLFAPITVQRSTGYILAGNHTAEAARELGWSEIDCYVVDVDDARALEINLAANKLSELGGFDYEALAAQLESVEDIAITGFTEAELEDLLVSLEVPASILPPSYDDEDEDASYAPDGERRIPEDRPAPEDNSDRREKFDPNAERRNSGRRLLVLDYPVAVFVWAADRLEELCKSSDIQTNGEMVLALLADATGSEAPVLTEDEEEA